MLTKRKNKLLMLLGIFVGTMAVAAFLLVPPDDATAFGVVFSGFRLTTVSDVSPDVDPQALEISSLQSKYPLAPGLTPGRIYVFDKITKMDNITFAKWVLPFRLWRAGACVTKRADQILYPFVGGPLYMVQFSKDRNRGFIFNRLKSTDNGKVEEILTFVYLGEDKTAGQPKIAAAKPSH